MYNFIRRAGKLTEVCDECGFLGDLLEISEVPARLAEVRGSWSVVMTEDERLLGARPASATWCALEYTEHTAFAASAIEWAAREFVQGRAPDWSAFRADPLGDATDDNHRCGSVDVPTSLRSLEDALRSLASFVDSLSEADLDRTADYGGGLILDTATVIRHAVHDAEHHLLDIRRGLARLRLNS